MSENKTTNHSANFQLEDSEIANDLQLLSSLVNNNIVDDDEENIKQSSDEENIDENSENNDEEQQDEILEDEEEEYLESETELLRSLMTACRIGNVNEVKRCISTNRVNINQHDPKSIYGHTPIMRAISDGHVEIVKVLLTGGADISRLGWDKDATALHVAIDKRNLDMVKTLLQSGKISKDCRNGYGESAEDYACKKGSSEIADFVKQYDHEKYLNSQKVAIKRGETTFMEGSSEKQEIVLPKKKRK